VADPDLLARAADRFGSQCVVLAIDARLNADGWYEVVIHGGRTPTGINAVEWAARACVLGAGEILLTSMDADGTKNGYDLPLTRAISDAVSIPVIASGGAGSAEHMVDAVREGHASAVLAASIFHFGLLKLNDVKHAMAAQGIEMRLLEGEHQ